MSYEEKQEKLKKRREAYHQQKREKCSQVTDQEKQQKIQKKCMHERERYANIQPNQKKAKLEQDSANRARRRDTLSKNSIAMENPANIATDNSQNVTQFATSIRHRKHVTPGEREALLAYRDEKLTAKTMGKTPATPDEDYSTNTKVIDDLESIKQPTNMKEGNTPNCIYDSHNQIIHASIFTMITTFHGQISPIQCVQPPRMKKNQINHSLMMNHMVRIYTKFIFSCNKK